MTRTYLALLVALVTSMGCRRTPPPAPPPPAAPPVASTPADSPPISVAPPPPAPPPPEPVADHAPAGESGAGAPASTAPTARNKRARSVGGAGGDETAQRKSAVRAAAEQQRPAAKQERPAAKQRGGRAHAHKDAEASSSPKVVAAREEVAGAPPSPSPSGAATARATLLFKNEAGATYKLVEARFVMDGAELPTVLKTAERGQTQAVFSGEIPAGRHVIAAHLTYQGADRAVFTYMKGYTFRVQSDDTFVARNDEAVAMTIVCKEKTGFNEPVEKRLFVTIEGQGRP